MGNKIKQNIDIQNKFDIRNTSIKNESTTVNHKEIYDFVFNVDNRQFVQLNQYVVNITNSLEEMANKGQQAAKKLNMKEAGEELAKAFKKISDGAKSITGTINGFDKTADAFGKMGKEGEKTSVLFDKFNLALNDTINKALQPIIKVFNEGMAPILAIIANGFQELGTSLGPLISIFGQLLQAGLQALVPILQFLGNVLVFVIDKVVQILAPLSNLASATSVLVPIITGLVITIGAIKIGALISMIPQLVTAFLTWAGSAGAAAGATLAAAAPIIGIGVAIAAGIAIVVALIQSWKELWNAAQVIWKAIGDVVGSYVNGWIKLFGGLGKIIWGALTFDKNMIEAGFNDAKSAVTGFAGTLAQAANESVNALGNAGASVWNNMVNNAKNAASLFQGSLTDTKRINQQITEEEKKRNEERAAYEREWTKKLRSETATRGQLLEDEKNEALAKAQQLGAKKEDIEAYFKKKSEDFAREEKEARERFEQQFTDSVEDNVQKRLKKLHDEKKAKIAEAQKLGADEAKILKYYKDQEEKIVAESEKKKRASILKNIQQGLSSTKNIVGKLQGLFNQYYDNRGKEIDANYEKEKQRIMESKMNEEEKKIALEALDQDTDKKKKALVREQAQTNKTFAIFNAIIDTAQAIVSSLAGPFPVNFVMAAIAGAMGAAQIALISAQPLPALASGGIVTSGGMALVGEQGPELVNLPQAASVIPLNRPQLSAAGFGGYSTANITLEIDGRTLVKQLGTPLRDMIRIKTGLK